MSRWLVGSSSSSRSGAPASARPSDARVSSPPENVASGRSRSSSSRNPRPCSVASARSRQRVAAGVLEPGLRLGVAAERRLVVSAVGHLLLERDKLRLDGHQLRRAREHVVAQRHAALARRTLVVQRDLGALGQHQLAEIDRGLAGEHPQQRRLAGAVAARQRHPVAALELERDAPQQRLARDVLAQVGCDDDGHRS